MMEAKLKKQLQHLDGVEVEWNVLLTGHTSLRVGGPVSCLLRPLNLAGLQTAVQVLNKNHHPKEALSGLEFIAGIPGSVGGALRMNAGTHAGEMADVCEAVLLLHSDGGLSRLSGSQLRFSYRSLELPPNSVVLEAEFSLTPSSREHIRDKIRALLNTRKDKQPWRLPSAGSVFKNPPGDFAGRLIEAAGLKGIRVGDAQISTKHANFIVNRGQARASDILALIQLAQEKVAHEFGVQLELEIEVVGNNHNT